MLGLETPFAAKLVFVVNETIEVNGKNQYKEVARFDMPFPTLEDLGIPDVKRKAANKEDGILDGGVDEDGVPVYESEQHDWLQWAVVQTLKAQNRNKLDGAVFKDGQKFPVNLTELVAVGERSGEALKNRHACRQAFAAYLKSKNKKDVVVKILSDVLVDTSSIGVAKDDVADGLALHITGFVATLSEADKGRYGKTLERAVEAINARSTTLEGSEYK